MNHAKSKPEVRPSPYSRLTDDQRAAAYHARPYVFDRVEVSGRTLDHREPLWFSIVGFCWSEYRSGPSLFMLADAAAEITGRPGWYGLQSARPRGFQKIDPLH